MASPRPQSSGRPASIKGGHVDSPLRNEDGQEINDKGEVIHIDPPAHRPSKIHGGGYDPPTEDLGPEGGNTSEHGGWVTERGYGTPILASDELKKHPDNEWRQPAVSPELERHGNEYTVNEDGTPQYITKQRTHSRSSSQNNNKQQSQRVISSPAQFDRGNTPLESHKEYEPLFPEDEEDTKRPKSQVDKLKRPSVARHHFPSQDVWEDTPGSLQLETTVETPQEPEEPRTAGGNGDVNPAKVFEDPEAEEQRKTQINKEDQQSFLPEHTRQFAAENRRLGKVRDETPLRPNMQQRFPSQDIWEDAPSHGHLETTVSTPQMEDSNEYVEDSPVDQKPPLPARPGVPSRPAKRDATSEERKAPIIPDRPKPQIPTRPGKSSTGSSEKVPTVNSQAGGNESPQPKAKPPVPARPAGGKIAALQAGFLKDLNSKLGVGPQAPKFKEPEPEEETEAAPLSDARKGRAKGPQRRKPAASPTPAATITAEVAVPRQKLDFGPVTAIWSFGEDGSLDVPAAKMAAQIQKSLKAPTKSDEPAVPESEADKTAEAESEKPELAHTATKDDSIEPASTAEAATEKASSILEQATTQASSTAEQVTTQASSVLTQATSQVSDALEPLTSKVSSALQSDEPLVKETVPGSVDIPGAFPGSGPDLDNEVEQKQAEDKPVSASAGESKSDEAKNDVAKEKEGAVYTQTFAG
jgi:hypothetical protein